MDASVAYVRHWTNWRRERHAPSRVDRKFVLDFMCWLHKTIAIAIADSARRLLARNTQAAWLGPSNADVWANVCPSVGASAASAAAFDSA